VDYIGTYSIYRRVQARGCCAGHSATSVAKRIGVSSKSLYDWVKRYGDDPGKASAEAFEVRRLKAELRRVIEERDILKKATAYFAKDHR